MILADLTIWTAAERGHAAGLRSLFNDLLQRGTLRAPACVFAQLIAEADDRQAKHFRQWATQACVPREPVEAWVGAGDLHALLHKHGVPVTLLDAYLLTLGIREVAPVWTFNPVVMDASRLIPIEIYEPPGVKLAR